MKTIFTFLICICMLMVTTIMAQPGSLDNTFGTGGKVITSIVSGEDESWSVAVQSDGKIIVGGVADFNALNADYALVRYNADGTLDATFGTGGIVKTDVGGDYEEIGAIAIQTDGKILIAGSSFVNSNADFSLVRYNSDGTLDTPFGTGGKVTTTFGNHGDQAFSIMLQPSDGKIILAGNTGGTGTFLNADFALARYNTDGSLDSSFGVGGMVTTAVGIYNDMGRSAVLQSDGKIVVGGMTTNNVSFSYTDFALVRYDTDGTLDSTFGTAGKVVTPINTFDEGRSVSIQQDGKIVLAGATGNSGTGIDRDFSLIRYNSDGTLDTGFGSGGEVIMDIGTNADYATATSVLADGKIAVVGHTDNGYDLDFALLLYNTDGSLDSTFGTNGTVTTDFGGTNDYAYSVAVQSDGKIIVSGFNNNDFEVARYNYSIATQINMIAAEQDIKLNVYPNPFNSSATIQFNAEVKNAELSMYDIYGRKIKTIQNISGQKIELQRDNLPNGVYFIHLTQDNKTIATNKLVITD